VTDSVNTRELILGILMEVTKEGSYSHLVIRSVLDKYQYLEKKDRRRSEKEQFSWAAVLLNNFFSK